MNCRKFCDFFNQWKGFLYGDTKLAFLAGNVYLDQDRDFAVVLYCFLTDRFCQTKRIDRMNQGNFSCNVFYFIPLQMTDHVPVDILWQHFLFFCQLLHFVFTEIAFAKIIDFGKHFDRFCLADRNQGNFLPVPSGSFAGFCDFLLDFFIVLFQHIFLTSSI